MKRFFFLAISLLVLGGLSARAQENDKHQYTTLTRMIEEELFFQRMSDIA